MGGGGGVLYCLVLTGREVLPTTYYWQCNMRTSTSRNKCVAKILCNKYTIHEHSEDDGWTR